MVRMMMALRTWSREMARCVVCDDECVTLFRCPNGHSCCVGCDASITDQRCPMCREPRSAKSDDTLACLLVTTRCRMFCQMCNLHVDANYCEFHRAWCPSHQFLCPCKGCHQTFARVDMASHILRHEDVVDIPLCEKGSREFVMITTRFNEDTIFTVNNDVFVISTMHGTNSNSLNELLSGEISFRIRCYYKSPSSRVWMCTLRQLQMAHIDNDSMYVEEFNVGMVPAVIASREQLVVSPYTPHITPRCLHVIPPQPRNSTLLFEKGRDLKRRLTTMGVRDVPWVTKPVKELSMQGPPTCVLRICLKLSSTTDVGSVFTD